MAFLVFFFFSFFAFLNSCLCFCATFFGDFLYVTDGVELPEVGTDSGLSSLRFFLGTGVTTGSAAASTDDSELDSESESESEEI